MRVPRCPTCRRRLAAGTRCPSDGTRSPRPSERHPDPESWASERELVAPEVPIIAGYRINDGLGEGGFARVWEAQRLVDEVPVAIKVALASTELARTRFAREAEVLARVGEPHVPALHARGELDDGRPYLVMELLREHTLAALLEQRVELPDVAWISGIGDAILAALAAVHARGLVHLDLKPEHIFISMSGVPGERVHLPRPRARLIDFGIAEQSESGASGPGAGELLAGSTEYMAPEQITAERPIGASADIYTFGVILYELFTLRVPFSGDRISVERGHSSLRPVRPSELASVPAALERLCLECLTKDARKRPADVAIVREQLAAACNEAGSTALRERSGPAPAARLLSGSRQPVVLLAVDTVGLAPEVLGIIASYKGVLCGQRGRRVICGFAGASGHRPEQAALAAARELMERHGSRAVLHIAELTIRPSKHDVSPKIYGVAVQDAGAWLPPREWSGIICTQELADFLSDDQTEPVAGLDGFRALIAPEQPGTVIRDEPPLIGRDDVLDMARARIGECLDGKVPGLFTIVGEHGLGKSRLLRALAQMGRDRAVIRVLEAGRSMAGEGAAGLSLNVASQLLVRALGDELQEAARAAPLMVILDDAHLADDVLLDALEYATLGSPGVALWVVVSAHPRLERRRPQWGERTERHELVRLAPLAESAAIELAAELLYPAEYPPRAALERLARWAAGNPQDLRDVVRSLKRHGLVRRSPTGGDFYVATAELERLPASPVGQWLATRLLGELSAELAACVRVCAVLGQEIAQGELAWVLAAADEAGTASTSVDADVGIVALQSRGILVGTKRGSWRFAKESFQDAIYRLVDPRDRHQLHHSALAYWRAQQAGSERVLAAIARHAGACGDNQSASAALIELGDRTRKRQRHFDADLHYAAALQYLEPGDHRRRGIALAGCGTMRCRMQRISDALVDLRQAQEHARAAGDDVALAEYILEEATALDWAARYGESMQRVETVRPLIEELANPLLGARYLMALGRSYYRSERAEEALDTLMRAAAAAQEQGDDDTRIIALLLLSTLYALRGRLDAAEQRFAEVIGLCEQLGDRFHLCAAYNNRAIMWSARGAKEQLFIDLRRAIQYAREAGLPIVEYGCTHNMAEFLHFSGRSSDALSAARRAYDLRRFLAEGIARDALLLGRILAALGDMDAARAMVDEARPLARSGDPAMSDELMIEVLDAVLAGGASRAVWQRILEQTRQRCSGQIFLEVLFFRARTAIAANDRASVAAVLAEAQALLADYPVWDAPFAAIAAELSTLSG